MIRKRAGGFTIPELLIATSVFSVVLLITTAAFAIIGHIFFKGVTITSTQENAQKILDSISSDISAAPNNGIPTPVFTSSGVYPGESYGCVGNILYSYVASKAVKGSEDKDSINTSGQFGLVRDDQSDCGTDPCSSATSCNFTNPAELLLSKGRVTALNITKLGDTNNLLGKGDSLWDIAFTIAYGDDSVLNGLPGNPVCKEDLNSDQFCAVSKINTTATQGFRATQ
ncbi:MAG TPA: prepilin-type N-terminal cleavage/methylation domain-containing protein [Candidatus Saccharimonadales bacterium]|nr:prepilin-type N-terminal cleavage/methylation domain-containing protein [Candidatus Saccharimonadales bacterium]